MRRGTGGAHLAALVLLALPLSACGDPSGVTARDLYGLWGGVSMTYTSQAEPAVSVDLVGSEGATYSLQLISGGTYESQFAQPGAPNVFEQGTFEVTGDRLLLEASSGPTRTYRFEFNQSLLTLRQADTTWDFDGDGEEEPAELEMLLDRF